MFNVKATGLGVYVTVVVSVLLSITALPLMAASSTVNVAVLPAPVGSQDVADVEDYSQRALEYGSTSDMSVISTAFARGATIFRFGDQEPLRRALNLSDNNKIELNDPISFYAVRVLPNGVLSELHVMEKTLQLGDDAGLAASDYNNPASMPTAEESDLSAPAILKAGATAGNRYRSECP